MANANSDSYYVPHNGWYPIWAAFGLFMIVYGLGGWLNDLKAGAEPGLIGLYIGSFVLTATLFFWFAKVVEENHAGLNNAQVKQSYVWGMGWFIFSEVMFFLAFFGALLYVRVFAVSWIGGEGDKGLTGDYLWPDFEPVWPVVNNPDPSVFTNPHESMKLKSFADLATYLPFFNTVVLVFSSFTVHWAHAAVKAEQRNKLVGWLAFTVVLGVIFIFLQAEEYIEAYNHLGLTLDSGIYGSTFFLLTGFHGFHVSLGTFMLFVQLVRAYRGHFTASDQFGLEASSWYWHFVDVVWICLFFFVYIL